MQPDPVREWREQYARCCLNVDFEPLPGTTFHASVKPIFPDLRIIRTASSPGFVFRDEDLIRDGNDSFELIVAQSQELNIAHQGREIRLGPGDATIMQASATGRVGSRERFGFLEVLVSPAEWETRGCSADDALMQHIGSNSGVLKLLRGYIRSLESSALTTSVEGREIVRRHMLDLIAVAATPHRSVGESSFSAVAAAHTHAIFDYLASHFSEPELSLSEVAQSLHISPRYLQRLLEASGTSFTAHVTELRLKHAFTLLTGQAKSDVRICDIAFAGWLFRYFPLQPAVPFPLRQYAERGACTGSRNIHARSKDVTTFPHPGLSDLGTKGLASRRGGRAGLRDRHLNDAETMKSSLILVDTGDEPPSVLIALTKT